MLVFICLVYKGDLYHWVHALGLEAISFAFSFILKFNPLLLSVLGSRDFKANEDGLTLCAELRPIREQYGIRLLLSHTGGRNQSTANGSRKGEQMGTAFKGGSLGSHS